MPKDTGRKLELGVGWLGLEVDGNGSDYQGIAEMTWVIEQHDKLRWAGGGGRGKERGTHWNIMIKIVEWKHRLEVEMK